jgi:hypothetical protein
MEIPFLANLVSYYVSLGLLLQANYLTALEKDYAYVASFIDFLHNRLVFVINRAYPLTKTDLSHCTSNNSKAHEICDSKLSFVILVD